jgi:pimeloyl-ACP methyl ester carboxylesterase
LASEVTTVPDENRSSELPPHDVLGEGPTMLFIHGTGADASAWAAIQPLFSRRFRTIAYDRRAHSRNRAPYPAQDAEGAHVDDAAALIAAYGGPACVVGWSRGGLVAIELALRRPNLVQKLILFEPPLHAPKNGDTRMTIGLVGTMLLFAFGRKRAAARRFFRMATTTDTGSDFDRLPEAAQTRALANAAAIQSELKIGTLESRDAAALKTLRPTLHVLVGTRSAAMYRRAARFLVGATGATLTAVEGAGHLAPFDAPDALAQAIAGCV